MLQCNKTHCTGEFWDVNRFRRGSSWSVAFRMRIVALGVPPWHSATHSQVIAERSRATSMNSTLDSQQQDQVVLLDGVPSPAANAPEPFVVANERRVVIAYRIAKANFERSARSTKTTIRFAWSNFRWPRFISSGHPTTRGFTLTRWRRKAYAVTRRTKS